MSIYRVSYSHIRTEWRIKTFAGKDAMAGKVLPTLMRDWRVSHPTDTLMMYDAEKGNWQEVPFPTEVPNG